MGVGLNPPLGTPVVAILPSIRHWRTGIHVLVCLAFCSSLPFCPVSPLSLPSCPSVQYILCPFVPSPLSWGPRVFRQSNYGIWRIGMPDYVTPCLSCCTKLIANLPLTYLPFIHRTATIETSFGEEVLVSGGSLAPPWTAAE